MRRGTLPFATGATRYFDSNEERARDARIIIRVKPGPLKAPVLAVVDTAAPWCIFKPEVGEQVRANLTPILHGVALSTRLGIFRGGLYRARITLLAEEGEPLDIEATVFLCPDWPGDNFVGYQGFLERIRFAVDPRSNSFYFGNLE